MSFFRGTSVEQDSRYFNKNKKLMAKMTFPLIFKEKVDIEKVNKEVMNKWITERVTELLGFEDEIVVSLAINLLEPKGRQEKLDPKELQMALTGFLGADSEKYMEELWTLLVSAQNNATGIPTEFLEKKKEELRLKKEQDSKQSADIQRRLEDIKRQTLLDVSSFARTRRERSRSTSRRRRSRSVSRSRSRSPSRRRRRRDRSRSPRRHRHHSRSRRRRSSDSSD